VHVAEENRYLIVSPKDMVVAVIYDANDKVKWYLKHKMYPQAMKVVHMADKYSLLQVGSLYVDFLFSQNDFTKAGEMCAQILGESTYLPTSAVTTADLALGPRGGYMSNRWGLWAGSAVVAPLVVLMF